MKKLIILGMLLFSGVVNADVKCMPGACTYTGPVPPDSWYRTPDQHLPKENTRGRIKNDDDGAMALNVILTIVTIRMEAERAEEAARLHREQFPHAYPAPRNLYGCTSWREVRDRYGRSYRELVCE